MPSCWEQQGFGAYNYGRDRVTSTNTLANEQGKYRLQFAVPIHWKAKTVRLVFDGVMTEAEVWINGQPAGPFHQGAFYRFKYDITRLLKFGEPNLLEVTVSKVSANESVNRAERSGVDYWVFGGIFRPGFSFGFWVSKDAEEGAGWFELLSNRATGRGHYQSPCVFCMLHLTFTWQVRRP